MMDIEELQAVRHTEQRMRALEIQLSAINRDLHSEAIQICELGDAMPRIIITPHGDDFARFSTFPS